MATLAYAAAKDADFAIWVKAPRLEHILKSGTEDCPRELRHIVVSTQISIRALEGTNLNELIKLTNSELAKRDVRWRINVFVDKYSEKSLIAWKHFSFADLKAHSQYAKREGFMSISEILLMIREVMAWGIVYTKDHIYFSSTF